MSAPVTGQENAPEIAADGQVKQRKKKALPLTSEQFTAKVNVVEAEYTYLHKYYTLFNKGGVRTGPQSPSPKETAAMLNPLSKVTRLYDYLCKPKKRTVLHTVKGFKREKLASADACNFFNTAAGFADDRKIMPLAEANGDGISSIAEGISAVAAYVARNGLKKNPASRTEITFDAAMTKLFSPHIGTVKREKWSTNEANEIVTTQPVIQALIPKLFDSKVPVHPTLFTDAEKRRMELRSEVLKKQTLANGEARKAKEDERKKAEKAEKKA
jgi:hypothetical protein